MYVLEDQTPVDVARAMITEGEQKEPFHVFDADEAYRRIQHFKRVLPRVDLFYALKALNYDWLLKLAISQGSGFDCGSPGEIKKIMELGVDPSLLIRIKVESDCTYNLGDKFGCDYETESFALLEEAASLGLNVVGVAFHVGSICTSVMSYVEAIGKARVLFDHEIRAGRRMAILDIGGGFLSEDTSGIDEAATLINKALEEYFSDPNVQIIAEPGRYICESSLTLYCSICDVQRTQTNNEPVTMIYLNEGKYGTLTYFESWQSVTKFELYSDSKDPDPEENVILWGPTGDSADRVMESRKILLPRCTPHDWLVFPSHGAYTRVFATNFSILDIPLIRPVISLKLWSEIKDCPVFNSSEFILKPVISARLPNVLPSLPLNRLRHQKKTIPGTAKLI